MKFKYLILFIVLFSPIGFSEDYSNVSAVENISVTETFVRVRLANMKTTSLCENQKQEWYALDPGSPLFSDMYATILAAKATQESTFFQLGGCFANYAKITVVYLCENSVCS